jgi:predicted N-formylglutamate amidohydrolase
MDMIAAEPEAGEFEPVERIEGRLDAGALVICDHARNALPREYGTLGLPREALQRHIAYDIGGAWMARRIAARLGAPALLSTFSRLLIDPNRGADDPTLVMRYSDGAIVPGNARADAGEIDRRIDAYWRPYRDAVQAQTEAMLATGEPTAIVSIHTFTPVWRGVARPWKVGVLWDADPRLPSALLAELARGGLAPHEIGDNEPYDGGLQGDTIDAVATARGLSNVLIEVRQDLVATRTQAEAWADRLAGMIARALEVPGVREPRNFGSRIVAGARHRDRAEAARARTR